MKSSAALAPALAASARIVARVAAGKSLAEELPQDAGAVRSERGALIDLTYGTLRRYGRVQAILNALSSRGRAATEVEGLLWCALYALESGRYADYTVVDQTVMACRLLAQWHAKGYVNAVLRAFLRERNSVEARIRGDDEARFQHPRWWLDSLRAAYPAAWQEVVAAGNSTPPMCLRVNTRRISVEAYRARLAAAGLSARPVGREGVLLEQPLAVERLPGFDAGEVSVQDAGAQRAAHCLELAAGQRVLDACAAPGGKAAHILEAADVRLVALDIDASRSVRIGRTFDRLGLSATVAVGDCARPADWWDGVPFDRVLADVPCSASGVVRRHPDLKWLRRAGDVAGFATRQASILDALWQVLAPGGKLLYVTCSVFPGENEDAVSAFLARTPGARRMSAPDDAPAQWLPAPEHDGFFYALIAKQA
jgi:16S rRNA (cytosine967-C5)-methyltransferase